MYRFLLESFRSKKNRPSSFFVNWLGMTLGLTAVIVIYLYVMQEVKHDKGVFTDSMESVYRCSLGDKNMGSITPSALKGFLEGMPEVESATRVLSFEQIISTEGLAINKLLRFEILFSDTSLFRIMPFKLLQGSQQEAIKNPNTIAVSRSTAKKIFDSEDVIGRMIKINNEIPVQITAVFEDVPVNSTFSPEIIASMEVLNTLWNQNKQRIDNAWGHWNSETYLELKSGVDAIDFEKKYAAAIKERMSESWGQEYKETITITPFQQLYFSIIEGYSRAKSVDPDQLTVMGLIALLVLVIAIINYVNIYTARSTEVIRAMGIKSIMGAERAQLIGFVIFDSVLITLISAISAFLVALALEPLYEAIIGSPVSFGLSWDMVLVLFVGIPLVCGVLSGIFPAISLTRIKPIDAMANRSSGNKKMSSVRNALIVFQFTISIALIGSTLFINKQMNYISTMNLGYNRDQIVVVKGVTF